MKKEEAIQMLKEERVDEWNAYRIEHPEYVPDLGGVNLDGKKLSGVNLSMAQLPTARFSGAQLDPALQPDGTWRPADLREAHLRGASFVGANLTGADLRSVQLGPFAGSHKKRKHEPLQSDLRGAKLRGADLSDADLMFALLQEADLQPAKDYDFDVRSTKLIRADLHGANLSKARLRAAILTRACLNEATLSGADLSQSKLFRAELEHADLTGADLSFAELGRKPSLSALLPRGPSDPAILRYARLDGADFRGTKWLRLDANSIREARLFPGTPEPWSLLRQKYTGIMMLFNLLFLAVFALPYIGRTVMWVGVNRAQEWITEAGAQEPITETTMRLDRLADLMEEHGAPYAGAVQRISEELSGTALAPTERSVERRIWQLLLGLDRAWYFWAAGIALLLYNTLRAILTWRVGVLREREEWFQLTPAWIKYRRLVWVHTGMNLLCFLAVASFIWHAYYWLTRPVWLPA